MPRFLLKTVSSNSEYNADVDYAIVEIDAGFARHILTAHAAFLKILAGNPRAQSITFYDGGPQYATMCEELDIASTEDDFAVIPENVVVPEDQLQRTEGDVMHVNKDGVYWTCYPKHSDVRIETVELPVGEVRKVLAGYPPRICPFCRTENSAEEILCYECARNLGESTETAPQAG